MNKKLFYILIIFLFATLSTCKKEKNKDNFLQNNKITKYNNNLKQIYINNIKLYVEIADTDEKRQIGLMYRNSMPDSTGMLFIHDKEDYLSYWMKNTYIDLAIFFVNSQFEIVDIKLMKAMDETPITSNKKAKYAIEVPISWYNSNKVNIGNKVTGI